MIAEQHAPSGRVERDEVRHQVLPLRRGRAGTKQRLPQPDPLTDAGLVGRLDRVKRADSRREPGDYRPQVILGHQQKIPRDYAEATRRATNDLRARMTLEPGQKLSTPAP